MRLLSRQNSKAAVAAALARAFAFFAVRNTQVLRARA